MTRRLPLAPLALACFALLALGAGSQSPAVGGAGNARGAVDSGDGAGVVYRGSFEVHDPAGAAADGSARVEASQDTPTAQTEVKGESDSLIAAPANADLPADSVLRAQVLLERAHFSPGVIDGAMGSNTRRAIAAYQATKDLDASGQLDEATWQALRTDDAPILIEHTLTEGDVSGPFRATPSSTAAMAELDALPYESVEEKVAEEFHIVPALLAEHNPGIALEAGNKITVPYVAAGTPLPTPARIVVDKSDSVLQLHDADGKVLAQFPVTTGSAEFPLPIGEWEINGVARDPVWSFDPKLIAGTAPDAKKAEIPPGPNNPVGVVWIDLSKEHYGIHGTPEPSKIGKTASNGCIRLTNWSALAVAKVVSPGMTASLRE